MPINTIIGLMSALIGSTATLLGAWAYIRSKHPSRKELMHGIIAVTVIMLVILGSAVLVSRATATPVDSAGKPTASPTPIFVFPPFPGQATPAGPTPSGSTPTPPVQTTTVSGSHSRPSSPASSTPLPASTPPPAPIPTTASTSVSSSIPLSSLTPTPTK